jgi:hypothetical protein
MFGCFCLGIPHYIIYGKFVGLYLSKWNEIELLSKETVSGQEAKYLAF